MKTKLPFKVTLLASMLLLIGNLSIYALDYNISFTATGVTNTIDNVQVQNLTQGTSVTVQAGETLNLTNITTAVTKHSINKSDIWVTQNESTGKSTVSFVSTKAGNANIAAYSFDGRKVAELITHLEAGNNTLELLFPSGNYAIRVLGNDYSYSAKLQSMGNNGRKVGFQFLSNQPYNESSEKRIKIKSATTTLIYNFGDKLLYTATSGGYIASVTDMTSTSKNIHFVFYEIPSSAIPAGVYTMGSPSSELFRANDETQHQVSLKAFTMSKYEITNAQYAAFLNANAIGSDGLYKNSTYPDLVLIYSSAQFYEPGLYYYDKQWRVAVGYENVPVVYVTWFGAFEFAKYLGGTLPTESQWEYACRGGTNTPFNTGACLTNLQANYVWASPYGSCTNTKIQNTYRQKVGLYPANQYGLYDMHGNVYEWCGSAYNSYPTSPQTDPPVVLGDQNVIRGGYWGSSALECRSAARRGGRADEIASFVGFRVVLPQVIVVEKPTVSTTSVSYIALTTAMAGGNVTDNGVASITARGVCYSTNANPTIADSKTFDGYGTGSFTSSISGLTANTTYFIRAYATNSEGTSYGEEKTFTTLSNNIQPNIQSVAIPAGTFTMGSPTTESNRTTGETQHQVTLAAFRMSKYEITNAQYADFLNTKGIGENGIYSAGSYPNERLIYSSNGHEPDWGVSYINGLWIPRTGYKNHPVIYVTWYGASEFAKYAGGFLPTEAQWEYACRAGSTTAFNTGNCLGNTQANYNWNFPQTGCTNSNTNFPFKTEPVSYNLPNAWGLYNMHGNVWEWCSDWYGEYPTAAQINPTGATAGTRRVTRGGSYISYAYHCRSAHRGDTNSPNNKHQSIGFRVAFLP